MEKYFKLTFTFKSSKKINEFLVLDNLRRELLNCRCLERYGVYYRSINMSYIVVGKEISIPYLAIICTYKGNYSIHEVVTKIYDCWQDICSAYSKSKCNVTLHFI